MYLKFYKPLFDFLVALLALLISSPIFLMVWVLLSIANKGRTLFIQSRPGRNGKTFKVIKFKTMNDHRNEGGDLLPDEQRLTSIGKWIRKTSMDEIPQLVNVIKGDMSLVGPRPLLVEYVPLYNDFQRRRMDVKPGITGWAQINGRNTLNWEDKFNYDVWYVDHLSFWLDIKIILTTILKIFNAEGISSGTSVSMERFTGNSGA